MYDLAGPAHDRSLGHEGEPAWCYLLCSTPRCGSTLPAEGLHATGVLGNPIDARSEAILDRYCAGRHHSGRSTGSEPVD